MAFRSNSNYVKQVVELESRVPKGALLPQRITDAKVRFYRAVYRAQRGHDLSADAAVLDFGCSFGSVVNAFCSAGYDAKGIDILEYWGKDRHLCGRTPVTYSPEVTSRLFLVDPENLRFPFEDRSIDIIVSDQVLEHVFDFEPIFREHARVLKPNGLAVHRFPRRYALWEVHTGLPFAPMSRYRWYLTLWALAGLRSERQKGFSWQNAVQTNETIFGTTNYVSKRYLLDLAQKTGLGGRFINHLPISESRMGRLYRSANRLGLSRIAGPLLMAVNMNHTLILESAEYAANR